MATRSLTRAEQGMQQGYRSRTLQSDKHGRYSFLALFPTKLLCPLRNYLLLANVPRKCIYSSMDLHSFYSFL